MTTFYCKDSPDLQVGPNPNVADNVKFERGFAEVPLDDPLYAEKVAWITHASFSYGITNLGEDAEQVPEGEGFGCPECGASFKTAFALKGHLRSHKPPKAKA